MCSRDHLPGHWPLITARLHLYDRSADRCHGGVGGEISHTEESGLLGVRTHSGQLISASLWLTSHKLDVSSARAAYEQAKIGAKNSFYEALQPVSGTGISWS